MELVTIRVKSYKDIPNNYTGIVEYANGSRYWLLNGEFHRTDGPAVELFNGTKHWYLNGEFHRTDGPAIEYANGTKFWYVNGEYYTKEEHFQYVAKHYPESIRKLIWNL